MSKPKDPLYVRKRAILFAVLLFGIAIAVFIFQKVRGLKDLDLGTVDTNNWIAALQDTGSGTQAVIIKPDLTLVGSPEFVKETRDSDFSWRPDGNRLYVLSDRIDKEYQIFRWNLASNKFERKTIDRGGRRAPYFNSGQLSSDPTTLASGIVVVGGFVREFFPEDGRSSQLLPPRGKGVSTDQESGSTDQFEQLYQKLGQSFKQAIWTPNRDAIVAVMRREDGEVLIVQPLVAPEGNAKKLLPIAVIAGEEIDVDMNADGLAVATVNGFQFVDQGQIDKRFIDEKGKVHPPYRNAVFAFDPMTADQKEPVYLTASQDDKLSFSRPRIRPNANEVMIQAGAREGMNTKPEQTVLMPIVDKGGTKAQLIQKGIFDPSWHPTGKEIVYTKADPTGKRAIYVCDATGQGERRVSPEGGSFRRPQFSPQSK